MSVISDNDKAILNSIFNPLYPVSDPSCDESSKNDSIVTGLIEETEDDKQSKELEIKGIYSAETGDLNEAEYLLTQAIKLSPNRSSLYNNRAQVFRLQGNETAALSDLDKAITLSEGGKGKSGRQALCQRALLYEKLKRQEDANKDWSAAARNGSQYAKSKMVQMNPYAALCNQMLQVVMATLTNPTFDKPEDNK